MSHAIGPVQQTDPQAAAPQASAAPKPAQSEAPSAAPHDKVTISEASKPAAGG